MAEIVETLAGDRRIRLYNEDFVRKLGIGTGWTKIRIGLRMTVQATSSALASCFTFGVCQGDSATSVFKSGSTVDFIGGMLGNAASNTYAYTAGPPNYISSGAMGAINRRAGVNTISSPGSATAVISANPAVRSLFFVDIEKNFTGNKILTYGTNPVGLANGDASIGQLMTYLEGDVLNTFVQTFILTTIPYSGPGLWDSINISWNNAIQPVEISDIIVLRIY
jgi:hypothetical protein